jgi:hypothetical protein
LKPSYFKTACQNLAVAEGQLSLMSGVTNEASGL